MPTDLHILIRRTYECGLVWDFTNVIEDLEVGPWSYIIWVGPVETQGPCEREAEGNVTVEKEVGT